MKASGIILMYHRIAPTDIDPWGMCVSVENFREHLNVFQECGNLMPLADLVKSQRAGLLPERTIAVTFDDGYVDNYTNAFPLLSKMQVPATIYLTSCNIDSERNFWWDELESIFLIPSQLPMRLGLWLGGQRLEWDLGEAALYTREQFVLDRETMAWSANPGTRMYLFYQVWRALWPLRPDERAGAIEDLKQWAGIETTAFSSRRCLNSRELRVLGNSPWIEIGAHTSHHSLLPAQPEDRQRIEIGDCKEQLESILGGNVNSFAYPHGEFTDETIRILRELGFESAVTVQARPVQAETDPLRLPRFGIKNFGGAQLARQLETWWDQATSMV